ncbi:MAG: arginase family protein [Pseudolabrys sp.]|nr:arginase family protein [Pseudolabrys sp.]
MPDIVIVQAPSALGLTARGVEMLPGALLSHGLAEGLRARRFSRVEPLPPDKTRDPETLILNADGIADYATKLAAEVGSVMGDGDFPLVLGGDCSILLGNLLALRRRGRYGLLFIDGHADFYQPSAEPLGEVASMELAFATGRGAAVLADIEGLRPLVRDEDVVVFGRRDGRDADEHGSQRIEDTPIAMIELDRIRAEGLANCIDEALSHLMRSDLDGFWLHLDADVLDDAIMPAVDYRMPDGLSWDELVATIAAARMSERLVGMDVTIFNPTLDKRGTIAADLAQALVRGLAPDAAHSRRSP